MKEQEKMPNNPPIFKLLVLIVDWNRVKKTTEVLRNQLIRLQYTCMGRGTASSEILDMLGIGSMEKGVILSIHPDFQLQALMKKITYELELERPGKGIAFTMPLSGAINTMAQMFTQGKNDELDSSKGEDLASSYSQNDPCLLKERMSSQMERDVQKTRGEIINHDLILTVVNQGFTDDLIHAAKSAGASGGTILNARRSGTDEAVKFFGISIQEEKEVVAILTKREQKRAIMQAINNACGIATAARGIIISLPVDSISGVSFDKK